MPERTNSLGTECIIIADDHPVFREALRSLVACLVPEAIVLDADTYEAALTLAREQPHQPSMFILDLFFSRKNIRAELEALRHEFDRSAIVVVTMAEDRATMQSILDYGINGFINKSISPSELIEALKEVRQGEIVVRLPEKATEIKRKEIHLSERQKEVLRLVADGKTNKEIAAILAISPFTVRIHVSAMMRALGVSSRLEATTMGLIEGLINVEDKRPE